MKNFIKKINNVVLIGVVAALVFGASGFYGGVKYQQSKMSNGMMFAGARNGTAGDVNAKARQVFGGMGGQKGMIIGEIISKDDTSIIVKLPDGGSKIIFFSGSTTVNKSVSGALADLETGKTAMITGADNSDGSITAQNIQIR